MGRRVEPGQGRGCFSMGKEAHLEDRGREAVHEQHDVVEADGIGHGTTLEGLLRRFLAVGHGVDGVERNDQVETVVKDDLDVGRGCHLDAHVHSNHPLNAAVLKVFPVEAQHPNFSGPGKAGR